jgi:hypothetical protein
MGTFLLWFHGDTFNVVQHESRGVVKAVEFVMDMFWGDRCGMVVDPDGYGRTVGTHKAEPTAQEMKKKMAEQMTQQPAGATTIAA